MKQITLTRAENSSWLSKGHIKLCGAYLRSFVHLPGHVRTITLRFYKTPGEDRLHVKDNPPFFYLTVEGKTVCMTAGAYKWFIDNIAGEAYVEVSY